MGIWNLQNVCSGFYQQNLGEKKCCEQLINGNNEHNKARWQDGRTKGNTLVFDVSQSQVIKILDMCLLD